ncbi:MAG: hypothetical protein ACK5TO_15810 [Planctomycetaceae bacterium]
MITDASRVCFVGIGSPHGDDVAGWLVAAGLRERQLAGMDVHVAASPIDLLDWVRPDQPLWVADACRGDGAGAEWQVWHWPCEDLRVTWGGGTHDFSLPGVLTLAGRLGRLPQEVRLWGLWRDHFGPGRTAREDLGRVVGQVVAEVERQWGGGDAGRIGPGGNLSGAVHA